MNTLCGGHVSPSICDPVSILKCTDAFKTLHMMLSLKTAWQFHVWLQLDKNNGYFHMKTYTLF